MQVLLVIGVLAVAIYALLIRALVWSVRTGVRLWKEARS